MRSLRWHMMSKHRMPQQEVDKMTNKRRRYQYGSVWTQPSPGQAPVLLTEPAGATAAAVASSAAASLSREPSYVTSGAQPPGDAR